MLEIIILALIGATVAGLWDLKTTEVPDPLPIGMVVIGVAYWIINWIITRDATPLIISLSVGSLLLAGGLLMYKKGQWGGADAWILAAIGYMIPLYNGTLFIIPYIMNFLVVSIAYTVVYAIIIGLLHRNVFKLVRKDFVEHAKIIIGIPVALAVAIFAVTLAFPFAAGMLRVVPLILLLLLFWRYAVVIEKRVFRRRIPTSRLKVGDVTEEMNWIGLTEKQIKDLRKRKRFVIVKDGMRFVPVFAIALVLTLLYGNLFFMIFG